MQADYWKSVLQKWLIDMKLKNILLIAMLGLSNLSYASFIIHDNKGEYGNARTPGFDEAINGQGDFGRMEQEAIRELLPPKVTRDYYSRFAVDIASYNIRKINNKSVGANATGLVLNTSIDNDILGLAVAVGRSLEMCRIELEGFALEKINYEVNPALAGVLAYNLDSKAQSFGVMANIYWDLPKFLQVQPFLLVGGGAGINRTSGRLIAASGAELGSESNLDFRLAWQAGAGLSYDIWRQLSAFVSFRYSDFGRTTWQPIADSDSFILSGKAVSRSFNIGLTYYF